MTPEEAFLHRLRGSSNESPKQVAREVGISGRAARRLISTLEAEGVVRSRVRGRVVVGSALLAACSVAVWSMLPGSESHDGPVAAPRRHQSAESLQKERDLYAALDRQDPARANEARSQLRSEEEGLRVAALRYLAGLGSTAHVHELLPLFDDPSARVRSVAIQLVGAMPGAAVDASLIKALSRPERPLSERLLAVSRLKERAPSAPDHFAMALVPVLLDGSQVLRDETSTLLALMTGKRVVVDSNEANAMHRAWREALGVSE